MLALGSPVEYEFAREDGRIRISFRNPDGAFEPWHREISGGAEPAAAAADAVGQRLTASADDTPNLEMHDRNVHSGRVSHRHCR